MTKKEMVAHAQNIGIEIKIARKIDNWKTGIHLNNPDTDELANGIVRAELEMFPAIYIHNCPNFLRDLK